MKIFQVVHSLDVGGTERVVIDIVKNLEKQGFEFGVVCLDKMGVWGEKLKKDGYKIWSVSRKPGWDIKTILGIIKIFNSEKPDIIHCHQYTPYFYGAIAAFFAKKRPKIIFTEHGRHQPDKRRWKRVLFNKLFLSHITDIFTGVSNFSKNCLIRYEGFKSEKIKVIYNGLDLSKYNTSFKKKDARQKAGINLDAIIIGHIGRLFHEKDQKTLIFAFQKIYQKRQDVALVIAGDGPLRKELGELVRNLVLKNVVCFLGTRNDVDILLKAFDVFVLSSITEATSVTVIEAMASGCPIVATDVGGNREVIGDNGILVESRNPEQLAQAIISTLDRVQENNIPFQTAKGTLDKFSLETMLKEYSGIYGSL
jgi:glycosyltransferase involved in cell wall biosynthesis